MKPDVPLKTAQNLRCWIHGLKHILLQPQGVYQLGLYNGYQEEVLLSKGQGRLADIDSHNKSRKWTNKVCKTNYTATRL